MDGLAAGAQDYMTKPVNKQELVARIHAQLQQRTRVRNPSFMPCASAVLTCQSYGAGEVSGEATALVVRQQSKC